MAGKIRLTLRPRLAQALAACVVSTGVFVTSALAATPAQVWDDGGPHKPWSALIVVPIALGAFIALIFGLMKIAHNDCKIERQFREESRDRAVTPIPDGDVPHHHFFH